MDWRVAESLQTLLRQINEIAPKRDRSSDGSIGDESHQTHDSDHNAWVRDHKNQPVVTARDFTNDPFSGMGGEQLVQALIASKDNRIKYMIWNRHIYSGLGQEHAAWQPRPYGGKSPHTHHVHVSVKSIEALYDDTTPWKLDIKPIPLPSTPQPSIRPVLKQNAHGELVAYLQKLLIANGAVLDTDMDFGPHTRNAVQTFQTAHKLLPDGIVGRYTWEALESGASNAKQRTTT